MPYPGLAHADHKILGSEYCSGYTDVFGKWNTGFYCPQNGATSAVFCCGTSYLKYCCTSKPDLDDEDEDETAMISPYTVRIPVYFAIFCGIVAVIILLITAVCFFCSCCFVYKKRRDATSTGLYRIQGSSSTVSALASMYSNQNSNSVVTTPLDSSMSDWSSQLPVSSYIPYPFSQSTLSTSSYPSSNSHSNVNNNNNNNIPAFYYNNNLTTPHNNSCIPNSSNCNSSASSISNLYQYQSLNHRPISALSTVSSTTSTYASNSNRSFPMNQNQQQRIQMLMMQQQQQQNGYLNGTQIRSQQSYLYRQQQQGVQPGQNYLQRQLHQQLNSFRNPAPSNETTTHQHQHQQGQGRFIQNNNYVSRHLQQQQYNGYQNSPYGNTNSNTSNAFTSTNTLQSTPTVNNNTIRGNTPRTQGNHLNQQERLATVQSLISAYRATANNIVNGSGATGTTPLSRNGPPSLNNGDINRLNAINLLVSAVLSQNRRVSANTNANVNGVIRASGRESSESTGATTDVNAINTTVSSSGNNETEECSTIGICTNGIEDNDGDGNKTISVVVEDSDIPKLTQDNQQECHKDSNENGNSDCDDQKVVRKTSETVTSNVPLSSFSERDGKSETRTGAIRDHCDDGDNDDNGIGSENTVGNSSHITSTSSLPNLLYRSQSGSEPNISELHTAYTDGTTLIDDVSKKSESSSQIYNTVQ